MRGPFVSIFLLLIWCAVILSASDEENSFPQSGQQQFTSTSSFGVNDRGGDDRGGGGDRPPPRPRSRPTLSPTASSSTATTGHNDNDHSSPANTPFPSISPTVAPSAQSTESTPLDLTMNIVLVISNMAVHHLSNSDDEALEVTLEYVLHQYSPHPLEVEFVSATFGSSSASSLWSLFSRPSSVPGTTMTADLSATVTAMSLSTLSEDFGVSSIHDIIANYQAALTTATASNQFTDLLWQAASQSSTTFTAATVTSALVISNSTAVSSSSSDSNSGDQSDRDKPASVTVPIIICIVVVLGCSCTVLYLIARKFYSPCQSPAEGEVEAKNGVELPVAVTVTTRPAAVVTAAQVTLFDRQQSRMMTGQRFVEVSASV